MLKKNNFNQKVMINMAYKNMIIKLITKCSIKSKQKILQNIQVFATENGIVGSPNKINQLL